MTFPACLRQKRKEKGWTHEQLAERSGVVAAAISHYECGRRNPSLKNLTRLANALGCGLDELVGENKETK